MDQWIWLQFIFTFHWQRNHAILQQYHDNLLHSDKSRIARATTKKFRLIRSIWWEWAVRENSELLIPAIKRNVQSFDNMFKRNSIWHNGCVSHVSMQYNVKVPSHIHNWTFLWLSHTNHAENFLLKKKNAPNFLNSEGNTFIDPSIFKHMEMRNQAHTGRACNLSY